MAKIYGKSGSTKYLLKGIKSVKGKNLTSLDEIQYFHDNFSNILAETTKMTEKRQDDLIGRETEEEADLEKRLNEGIARRTVEVNEKLASLEKRSQTAGSYFARLSYRIQYQIHSQSRHYRIRRPFRHIERELSKVRGRKAGLIANKPVAIALERSNLIESHAFLMGNQTFFIGAKGEEEVIGVLSRLPDAYHVFNDVKLHFDPPIHWKETDESIVSSQIDHIVVGPTGIFSLETKNWKPIDFETKSEKLEYQVKRSNLSLWYYLKHFYGEKRTPRVRNVIVSMQEPHLTEKIGKYIDVVSPHQLCDYIHHRRTILSDDDVSKLTTLISRRIS